MLTGRLARYGEWFVFVPAGAETEHTEHYLDGGLTFAWSNDLQFDFRVGTGLSEHATDFFSGTGAVWRF